MMNETLNEQKCVYGYTHIDLHCIYNNFQLLDTWLQIHHAKISCCKVYILALANV